MSVSEVVEAICRVHAGEAVLHPTIAKKVLQRIAGRTHTGNVAGSVEALSEREKQVLRLAAQGKANKEVAALLSLSERTVQAHLSRIFNKLGVASRTEAVIRALRLGWLRLEEIEEISAG